MIGLIECYDVIHRYLMVNRGYELIVCTIFWVIKNFPKCWHEVCDDLKWYLKHDMWMWCGVDFECDLIVLSRWKGTFKFEIGAITLLSHIFFMKCLNRKRDRHSLNMYFIRIHWYWWWVWWLMWLWCFVSIKSVDFSGCGVQ